MLYSQWHRFANEMMLDYFFTSNSIDSDLKFEMCQKNISSHVSLCSVRYLNPPSKKFRARLHARTRVQYSTYGYSRDEIPAILTSLSVCSASDWRKKISHLTAQIVSSLDVSENVLL